MNNDSVRRISAKTLIVIALVIGAAINLIPFIWMLSTSLKTPPEVFKYPPSWIPNPFEWENYRDAYRRINGRVFFNSAFFALMIVLLMLFPMGLRGRRV